MTDSCNVTIHHCSNPECGRDITTERCYEVNPRGKREWICEPCWESAGHPRPPEAERTNWEKHMIERSKG